MSDTTTWELLVVTEGTQNASTDNGKIYASLVGKDSSGNQVTSSEVKLDNDNTNEFRKGYVDTFVDTYTFDSTSSLTHLKLRSDSGDKWCVHRVYLTNMTTGKIWKTKVSSWLEKQTISFEVEEFNSDSDSTINTDVFNIKIHTSTQNTSGSNNKVFIKLISQDGIASESIHLNELGNNWTEGSTYNHRHPISRHLSRIDHVLLFKDGQQGWFPDQVTISAAEGLEGQLLVTTQANNTEKLNGKENGLRNLVELSLEKIQQQDQNIEEKSAELSN
ncbi:hypothetical protein LF048_003495 [Vibrio cholerae]|nr:hypothetical protein [Vibrio cholerae]